MNTKAPRVGYIIRDVDAGGTIHGSAQPFIRERLQHWFPDMVALPRADTFWGVDLVVELSVFSPLIDEVLLQGMLDTVWTTGNAFEPVDAIPGTAPVKVFHASGANHALQPYFSLMQPNYCTNFGIRRPNRAHIFSKLQERQPALAQQALKHIIDFIESDEGLDFVLSYGEQVPVRRYTRCPGCQSDKVQDLHAGTSHPLMGFITKNRSVYAHCHQCGLTYMSRQLDRQDLWRYYQDYSYKNLETVAELDQLYDNLIEQTVSHLANYIAVAPQIKALGPAPKIADLGAGRGEFAAYSRGLRPDAQVVAIDWRFDDAIGAALKHRDIQCISGDLLESLTNLPQARGLFDLITAWEVIEHLKIEDLRLFLTSVLAALKPQGLFILSTPDFNDPHCRAMDFWAMAPGEHISVLSRRFLEPLLRDCGLVVVDEKHESVMMKDANRWFLFGAETDVHFASKANTKIVNDFLSDDESRLRYRRKSREMNIGSELILTIRRI